MRHRWPFAGATATWNVVRVNTTVTLRRSPRLTTSGIPSFCSDPSSCSPCPQAMSLANVVRLGWVEMTVSVSAQSPSSHSSKCAKTPCASPSASACTCEGVNRARGRIASTNHYAANGKLEINTPCVQGCGVAPENVPREVGGLGVWGGREGEGRNGERGRGGERCDRAGAGDGAGDGGTNTAGQIRDGYSDMASNGPNQAQTSTMT